MKLLNSLQPLSLFLLRSALALIFLYHGYPKLVHANEGMREFFMLHGLPAYFVSVAGILECFGSILLFVGLFTRVAALLLTVEMIVAIWKVHSIHGPLVVKEYEFPLVIAAACLALATVGAGSLSVDSLFLGDSSTKRHKSKSTKD